MSLQRGPAILSTPSVNADIEQIKAYLGLGSGTALLDANNLSDVQSALNSVHNLFDAVGLSPLAPANTDRILLLDASDGLTIKYVTVQSLLALAPGGGGSGNLDGGAADSVYTGSPIDGGDATTISFSTTYDGGDATT